MASSSATTDETPSTCLRRVGDEQNEEQGGELECSGATEPEAAEGDARLAKQDDELPVVRVRSELRSRVGTTSDGETTVPPAQTAC